MIEETPREARHGRRGWGVWVILALSLLLAMIVWLGVALYGSYTEPDSFRTDEGVPGTDAEVEAVEPQE